MVFTPGTMSAGLALFSLGLAAKGATAVSNCAGLIDAIGVSATIILESDFSCSEAINVGGGETVSVSGPHVITIDADFDVDAASTSSSLFVNEGSLTLDGVTVESQSAAGIRAVHNEGDLILVDCTFSSLFGTTDSMLSVGGVVFSDSAGDIDITDSAFTSNAVSDKGGALYVIGSETLTIKGSTFTDNVAGPGVLSDAAGGDIYAGVDVEITISDTTFTGSQAEYGGASIECCGGSITTSSFSNTKSDMIGDHFGALLVGRRGADVSCPRTLELTDTTFTGCEVDSNVGAGGAVAVFDTTARISGCVFEGSVGTAVLFESSSAEGMHKIEMSNNQFNKNTFPAEAFAAEVNQGAAVVVVNTGLAEGEDFVPMGSFTDMYCFANEPYECEFVYDLATITHDGEFKCHVCDMDGVRQVISDDDYLGGTGDATGDAAGADSGSSGDNSGTILFLSLALGGTLVVIGALAVWKIRVRKQARRLMDDMDDNGEF
eukprot:g2729.t1